MSPNIERVLMEESEIIVTVRIPVDVDADQPLSHLANEGKIQEAVRLVGHQATESLYQHIADRDNETEGYENIDGYWMRQESPSTHSYASPYGHIRIKRPYFYNDHTHTGDIPFEREARMDVHRLTPMTQYLLLRQLAEKGPQACAEAMEEDYGLKLSHHLVDAFLEDMGTSYQEGKPEWMYARLEKDWEAAWLPASIDHPKEEAPTPLCLPLPVRPTDALAPPPSLGESVATPTGGDVLPVVQCDAMNVTIRKYDAMEIGKITDGRKYHTERHHLHNAVIGFVLPDGPREPGDKIDLKGKRYISEYFFPDALPERTRLSLEAEGLKPGDQILLYGDGDPKIWDRYEVAFETHDRIEILDERHARTNLRKMAELSYPTRPKNQTQWLEKRLDDLYQGRYDHFFYALNYLVRRCDDPSIKDPLKTKRGYFRRNQNRIRYHDFLRKGYPISTCFVESAHNHVIGDRVRNNGRTYREDRLQIIVDFRCEYKSKRLPYVFQRLMAAAA
jgi:hypothetical protein